VIQYPMVIELYNVDTNSTGPQLLIEHIAHILQ